MAAGRIGVYLPPFAWAASMGANYALEPVTCHQETRLYLWSISLVALLAALFGAWKAWIVWQEIRKGDPADPDVDTLRFVAVAGMGLGVLCAIVIIAQAIPTFYFHPCQ